jgi:hypothetical protein
LFQAQIVFELDKVSVLSRILSAAAFGAEAEQEEEVVVVEEGLCKAKAMNEVDAGRDQEQEEQEETEEMEAQEEDGDTEEEDGLVNDSSIVTLLNHSSVVTSTPLVPGDGDEDEESDSQDEQTRSGGSSPAHGASDEAAGSGPRADKSQSMKWKRRRGELLV